MLARTPSVALLALTLSLPAWSAGDLISRFSKSSENWRVDGDGVLSWMSAGGNPGGYLQGNDQAQGILWYYVSPQSWHGDWRGYSMLRYDMKRFNGNPVPNVNVIIVGANGTNLQWTADEQAGTDWTAFRVKLSPQTFGVSADVYKDVMRDVVELHILGEVSSGADIEGLDNVVVSSASAPEFAGQVTALPVYKLVCKNATTGQSVTKPGQTSTDWNCEDDGLVVNDGDQVSVTISGKAGK